MQVRGKIQIHVFVLQARKRKRLLAVCICMCIIRNNVHTSGGSSVLLSSPASVSDDGSGPRCLNLSSTESILGVTTSYLESFCKRCNKILEDFASDDIYPTYTDKHFTLKKPELQPTM